jgi:F0F1-type ATP synthase membrane subunit a
MKRKHSDMMQRDDIKPILKSLAATLVMAAAVYAVYVFASGRMSGLGGNIAIIALCGAVGVIVYAVMLLIMGAEELKTIVKTIKK